MVGRGLVKVSVAGLEAAPKHTLRSRIVLDASVGALEIPVRLALGHHRPEPVDVARLLATGSVVPSLGHVTLLIVGQRSSHGAPTQAAVARLREACPHIGIFLVGGPDHAVLRRLAVYTRAGVDEVFPIGDEKLLARFAAEVHARVNAPPPDEALWLLAALPPSALVRVPPWCIRNAYRKRLTDDIARRFDMDRTTLQRKCTATYGVSPNELIRLGRLLHFDELRRTTNLTRQQIVLRLGMESRSAISMLKARLRGKLSARWQVLLPR